MKVVQEYPQHNFYRETTTGIEVTIMSDIWQNTLTMHNRHHVSGSLIQS
jgi:hypothetical protein